MKFSIFQIGLLSVGFCFGGSAPALASGFTSLSSADDFYNYYGTEFSPEAKSFISDLYDNLTPFFGADGLNQAIAAGYVPMTPEAKYHGTHWFNPQLVYNFMAEPTIPSGLNFNEDNQLVAIFWGETKYANVEEAAQSFLTLPPASLPAAYGAYKANNQRPVPNILEPFDDLADWHSHENVVIENIGVKDPIAGIYDPEAINFRQSLTDANFIAEILESLQNDQKVAAPFEFDPSSYPPFNVGIHPGFYMAHMWVGAGNPEGPFNTMHLAISPDGLDEHTTFEDGSGGHSHSPGHGGTPKSVPEPSFLLGLLSIGALSWLKIRNTQPQEFS